MYRNKIKTLPLILSFFAFLQSNFTSAMEMDMDEVQIAPTISTVPNEILHKIFYYIDELSDCMRVAGVCRLWREGIKDLEKDSILYVSRKFQKEDYKIFNESIFPFLSLTQTYRFSEPVNIPEIVHPRIKELNLIGCGSIGDELGKDIARFEFTALTSLSLRDASMSVGGATALATSTRLINLTELDLGYNIIGKKSVMALANGNLTNLTSLNLEHNLPISTEEAKILATGNSLFNLTSLNLASNFNIKEEGARSLVLATSDKLISLTVLALSEIPFSANVKNYLKNIKKPTLNLIMDE
ncbi:F-box/LRR-repeat protein [Candidatus Paracaedibacter symbiosus]|uniref:F-box/LRR-repeat protein n=1 Tax=Candidatus Paracaedibacter symbiosus TaxID=244582 RepID=UPI00068DD73B|nr:F-box/LRR-repeat protein [Candidatus Paracaedibacter symbiosus]